MISFSISLICLILGYFIYGKFVERVFHPENKRKTPSIRKNDGVDFIELPSWKVFMIQFLNIAGTGPIFGAIMGMWFGPAAYLWIVLGCIFAGATHDYLSGMISVRKGGISQPEIVGQYLGKRARNIMMVFTVVLLTLVGAVFVLSPATLLAQMSIFSGTAFSDVFLWVIIVFLYYILATMLPVDKIIGKIYPLFAISILFMCLGLLVCLFIKMPGNLPEIWDGLGNLGAERLGIKNAEPIVPALFITIACGAISGFHATQSPLMARCIKTETLGRPIFYGSMITEGIVALVWATVSSWFFFGEGWKELCPDVVLGDKTVTQFFAAPSVVMHVCNGWLGVAGGILAILGVIAAPITSGDTALRSARLIVADAFHIDQKPIAKRLMVCAPIFALSMLLLWWQMDNPDSFKTVWNYFGWSNQALSVFTLWAITVYLALKKRFYFITLIPAMLMTFICTSYLLISNVAFGLAPYIGYIAGIIVMLIVTTKFFMWKKAKYAEMASPDYDKRKYKH